MWSSFIPPGEIARKMLWLQPFLIKHGACVDLVSQVGHLLALPEALIPGSGLDHITAYDKLAFTSARG